MHLAHLEFLMHIYMIVVLSNTLHYQMRLQDQIQSQYITIFVYKLLLDIYWYLYYGQFQYWEKLIYWLFLTE